MPSNNYSSPTLAYGGTNNPTEWQWNTSTIDLAYAASFGWLRFSDLGLPSNATIDSAALTLDISGSPVGINEARIFADVSNLSDLPQSRGDADSRSLTTASATDFVPEASSSATLNITSVFAEWLAMAGIGELLLRVDNPTFAGNAYSIAGATLIVEYHVAQHVADAAPLRIEFDVSTSDALTAHAADAEPLLIELSTAAASVTRERSADAEPLRLELSTAAASVATTNAVDAEPLRLELTTSSASARTAHVRDAASLAVEFSSANSIAATTHVRDSASLRIEMAVPNSRPVQGWMQVDVKQWSLKTAGTS